MGLADAELAPVGAATRAEEAGRDRGNSGQAGVSTREKILDVALDLFTDQGFDGTSIREIADRLHISKPAIYHHFASKEEILLTLHMRLHESGKAALARLSERTMTLQTWGLLLDDLMDQMAAQRRLFLMHERNHAALEKLRRKDLDDEHEDIQQQLQQALADPALSLRDRVRMACSLAATSGGLSIAGEAFNDVSAAELDSLVRDAVHDLLADHGS